jgi:MFS family permease
MQNQESISEHAVRNILTRDFIIGFFTLLLFAIANTMLVPTLPVYFASLGSNEREIGILIGTFGATSLIFRFLVGGAVSKYSEKGVVIISTIIFGITFLASIILRPFWPFLFVRIFQGISFSCMDTALLTLIVNNLPVANRGQGIGYFLMAPTLSFALGPVLGMFIINHASATVLFSVCAALCLCSFFCSLRIKGRETPRPDNLQAPDKRFFDPRVIPPAILSFLHSAVWGSIMAFLPLYAIKQGISNPGLFFSTSAIMTIAVRVFGGGAADKYSTRKIIVAFLITSIAGTIMLSFAKTLLMFIAVGMLWGTQGAFLFPAFMTYSFDYAGSSSGTAMGTFRGLGDSGLALGPMVMGIIIPLTGYRVMFLCLSLICFVNLCYFQFYLRKRNNVTPTV